MRVLLVAALFLVVAVAPADASPINSCVGKPGSIAACTSGDCASVGVGLQGVRACASTSGVTVCVGFNCHTVVFA